MKFAPMPWMRCGPGVSVLAGELWRDDRRLGGLDRDGERAREALLEIAAGAGDGAARADAGDERAELETLERRFDLRAGGGVVGPRVGRVVELAGDPRVRRRVGDLLRGVDRALHALGLVGEHELGTERLEQLAPLDRHRLGHRENDLVASRRADQRERDAGVAARGLDDDGLAAA